MTDYQDVFGREPEAWRVPAGALLLTLADESQPAWQLDRARAELKALIAVLSAGAIESPSKLWDEGFTDACREFADQRRDPGHPITRTNPYGRIR